MDYRMAVVVCCLAICGCVANGNVAAGRNHKVMFVTDRVTQRVGVFAEDCADLSIVNVAIAPEFTYNEHTGAKGPGGASMELCGVYDENSGRFKAEWNHADVGGHDSAEGDMKTDGANLVGRMVTRNKAKVVFVLNPDFSTLQMTWGPSVEGTGDYSRNVIWEKVAPRRRFVPVR